VDPTSLGGYVCGLHCTGYWHSAFLILYRGCGRRAAEPAGADGYYLQTQGGALKKLGILRAWTPFQTEHFSSVIVSASAASALLRGADQRFGMLEVTWIESRRWSTLQQSPLQVQRQVSAPALASLCALSRSAAMGELIQDWMTVSHGAA